MMVNTSIFKVCKHVQHDASKTKTIAKQSEVPIEQYVFGTRFLSIGTKSRYFMILSLLLIKVILLLEQLSLGKTTKRLTLKTLPRNANIFSMINPQLLFLPHRLKRIFLSFPLFIKSNKPTFIKHKTVQTLHSPLKKQTFDCLKLKKKLFSTEMPHPNFL